MFQFTPARITFTEGSEALRCMRLGPKGPLRWYTDCCKTPVANTFAHRPSPFFDDDGEPICVPTVLTLDERSALRAQAESPPR
ncbi:MAG: hypothetical protein KTR31_19035 [Myxococcales bacterium]|nr:hypothetical protein [Myxococcales bacterium]